MEKIQSNQETQDQVYALYGMSIKIIYDSNLAKIQIKYRLICLHYKEDDECVMLLLIYKCEIWKLKMFRYKLKHFMEILQVLSLFIILSFVQSVNFNMSS